MNGVSMTDKSASFMGEGRPLEMDAHSSNGNGSATGWLLEGIRRSTSAWGGGGGGVFPGGVFSKRSRLFSRWSRRCNVSVAVFAALLAPSLLAAFYFGAFQSLGTFFLALGTDFGSISDFLAVTDPTKATVYVQVDGIHATTSDNFICATMDWWPPEKCDYGRCSWGNSSLLNLNISHPTFRRALTVFSPFLLRLGGSLQDHIVYQMNDEVMAGGQPSMGKEECRPIKRGGHLGFNGGCLTTKRWDALCSMCLEVGCRIAFGLNALRGRTDLGKNEFSGAWDSANAEALLNHSAKVKCPVHAWLLGNELVGDLGIGAHLSADLYAEDVKRLRAAMVRAYGERNDIPLLGAPDSHMETPWIPNFLEVAKGEVDIITLHNYFLEAGVDPGVKDLIMDPQYTKSQSERYTYSWKDIHQAAPGVQVWMSEAGGAYNSGQPNATNSFMSGFWYLNELGLAASHHYARFCRQTFIGGSYSLLNPLTFEPNPDFYSAVLWKRLMGTRVLKTSVSGSPWVHAFAHCSRQNDGGLVLLLLNYNGTHEQSVHVKLSSTARHPATHNLSQRREFRLTTVGGDIQSQSMLLNGQLLSLENVDDLAQGVEVEVNDSGKEGSTVIMLAPHSYAFIEIPRTQLAVCQEARQALLRW
eukprot:TRINITY_DN32338_c0_g1_i1.p1 TRINITY_DN32338_c0_g1~~TRINITY_DN32338_c0_g1_i1.p1  ORF type:complete len:641 (+),score=76.78 TRINITY_DN32338_c0_g1_i1:155-2077(+)